MKCGNMGCIEHNTKEKNNCSAFITERLNQACNNFKPEVLKPAPELETPTVMDSQVGGDHYKKLGLYQPWYVYSKWFTPEELKGAMKKEVLAYLQREASKGGREDIKKAHHTLGIYLELTQEQDNE